MWFLSYIEINFALQADPDPSLDFHHTAVRSYS